MFLPSKCEELKEKVTETDGGADLLDVDVMLTVATDIPSDDIFHRTIKSLISLLKKF